MGCKELNVRLVLEVWNFWNGYFWRYSMICKSRYEVNSARFGIKQIKGLK